MTQTKDLHSDCAKMKGDVRMEQEKKPGQRIKELRCKANLTQADLAKKMSITREHLAKLESGTRNLQAEDVPRFAALLGTTCDYILAGIDTGNVRLSRQLGLDNQVIEKLAELSILAHMFDTDFPSGNDGITKAVISRKAREKLEAVNFVLSADHDFQLIKSIYEFIRMDFSKGRQGLYTKDEAGNMVLNKDRNDDDIYELMFFDASGKSPIHIPVSAMRNAVMETIKVLIEKMRES